MLTVHAHRTRQSKSEFYENGILTLIRYSTIQYLHREDSAIKSNQQSRALCGVCNAFTTD